MESRRRTHPTFRALLTERLLGLTLLSTIIITILGGGYLALLIKSDAEEHLLESAIRIRDGMDHFVSFHRAAVDVVADRLSPGAAAQPDLAGQMLENTLKHYPDLLTMLVTDANGQIIRACRRNQPSFAPGPTDNQTVSDRPYFREPQCTGQHFISGIIQGRGLGQDPIVAISAPIFDASHRFAGVVEASVDITRIPVSPLDVHRGLITIVHDNSANIVYSSKPKVYAPLRVWDALATSSAARPKNLFRITKSALGEPHYAVRLPMNCSGWQVIAAVDVASINRDIIRFYWLTAGALILLTLLSWQIAKRMANAMAGPVASLVEEMQRFEPDSDKVSTITPQFPTLEFHQIYAEFRRLGDRLRDAFQTLDQKVAERTAQLAESEARYRQLIDTSGDIIYRTDARGFIQFHNPSFEKLLGFNALGRRLANLITDEYRERFLDEMRSQKRNLTSTLYCEFPVMCGDGRTCWIGQSTQLITDESGAIAGYQAIGRDITEQKIAEQARREAEERYALAVTGSNNGIWDWDTRTGKVYFSNRWKQMFGIAEDALLTDVDSWLNRVHPSDAPHLGANLSHYVSTDTGKLFEQEHRMRHEDGTWRWVLTCGAAVRNAEGKALRIAGSTTDITSSKLEDPFTGLPNRLAVLDHVERLMLRQAEDPTRRFAVLFMDIDRFKMINDSMGHQIGDELIFAVSRRIAAALYDSAPRIATLGRLGGDEFVVIVEHDADAVIPVTIAEAILQEMAAPHHLKGTPVFISLSIGIAYSEQGMRNPEDLLRNADTAMYQAKTDGRARYAIFDQSMHKRAVARLELETDLRRALEFGEFILHYQPQVDLRTGALSGFEALVRWVHPKRGLVPPNEFITAAEENGLILPLGRWVLEEGLRQLAEWDQLSHAARNLALSVNLSPAQFADPNLQDIVRTALERTGISPKRLHLEVTESMVASDPKVAQASLKSLAAMGVGLEIDDFGTGYSCLGQLHQLPFDTLKVDRSFVQAMDQTSSNGGGKIVESIARLSASLGIHVIAEGIETQEHWIKLAQLGCEFGQGYFFSRPLAAKQAFQLLQVRSNQPWPLPQALATLLPQLDLLRTRLENLSTKAIVHIEG